MPFGAAQVVPSLLGGHVDAVVQLPAALVAPVKQGTVRLLAALIPSRDPALPEVPTAREQGVDVALEAWRGIAVPRGTPAAMVAALERAIRKTVESAGVRAGQREPGRAPGLHAARTVRRADREGRRRARALMQQIGLKK